MRQVTPLVWVNPAPVVVVFRVGFAGWDFSSCSEGGHESIQGAGKIFTRGPGFLGRLSACRKCLGNTKGGTVDDRVQNHSSPPELQCRVTGWKRGTEPEMVAQVLGKEGFS